MKETTDFDPATNGTIPPVCRPTVDRLQRALDGELPATALDLDPHPSVCAACRERIFASRLILSVLATAPQANPLSVPFTDRVLSALRADRRARARRRTFALVGALAVAATIFLAAWFGWPFGTQQPNNPPHAPDVANVQPTKPVPELAPAPRPAPEVQPMRLSEEFAKAEHALLGSSRPITEPAALAPQVLVKLTDVLTRPPGAAAFEPARISLVDLPDAARTGFQPVTTTAQKAFTRLLHDVGAVQLSAPPN